MTDLTNATSLSAVLHGHAGNRAGADAVLMVTDPEDDDRTTRLTYGQLDDAARRIAGILRGRYDAGDRVLLLYPMGTAFVTAFVGCLYAGVIAVPAPLPGRYRHERMRVYRIAGDAGVVAALTDEADAEAVRAWAREERLTGVDVLVTDTGAADPGGHPALPEPVAAGHDRIALLQYTSGSTGDPKGVTITHGSLLSNVDSLARAFGFDETTRTGGWIPLYHDMGLMGQLLPALLLGSSCALMNPMTFLKRPISWLTMIDHYDVAWSAAPNFAFEHCRRRVGTAVPERLDLSRWRYAANGSEPVRASTLAAFAEAFAPAGFRPEALAPCYGLAESTVFVSGGGVRPVVVRDVDATLLERDVVREADPAATATRQIVSCGVPRDCEVLAVDPETSVPVPAGTVGELWLRGPSVSAGYWGDPSRSETVFGALTADGTGPYLRTGDLGLRIDGELYVTGRIKEMLTAHGRNLYPQDIEHELSSQHERLDGQVGAVFTVAGPADADEALVVLHETRGRAGADELADLSVRMRQTVAREFGVTVGGVVLLRPGSVRRTTSGKIQRTAMRELFLADELSAVYADKGSRDLVSRLRPQADPVVAGGR